MEWMKNTMRLITFMNSRVMLMSCLAKFSIEGSGMNLKIFMYTFAVLAAALILLENRAPVS